MTWFRRLAPWAALLLVVAGLVVAVLAAKPWRWFK